MNIQKAISEGQDILKNKNIETSELDSEILMANVIQKDRRYVILNSNEELKEENLKRFKNFFEYGISSNHRTAACYYINNVQNLVNTPNSSYDPDKLMELYIRGYRIFYKHSDFDIKKLDIVPKNLLLKKLDNKSIVRYKDLY